MTPITEELLLATGWKGKRAGDTIKYHKPIKSGYVLCIHTLVLCGSENWIYLEKDDQTYTFCGAILTGFEDIKKYTDLFSFNIYYIEKNSDSVEGNLISSEDLVGEGWTNAGKEGTVNTWTKSDDEKAFSVLIINIPDTTLYIYDGITHQLMYWIRGTISFSQLKINMRCAVLGDVLEIIEL